MQRQVIKLSEEEEKNDEKWEIKDVIKCGAEFDRKLKIEAFSNHILQ